MTTPSSSAVEQRDQGPGAMVEQYRGDIAMVLPSHINTDQWCRMTVGLMRRNPQLAAVARKNPGSFMSAVLECARLGLEPGDTYHFVAFGNEITGIVDFTGEVELIYRTGEVASVKCEVVHANDEFRFDPGTMDRPEHKVDWFSDRGALIGVYAYAVMKNGSTSRVVMMPAAEVELHEKMSRSASSPNSPWKKWRPAMFRKTAIHQLYHWVPSSAEYRENLLKSTAAAEAVRIEHGLPPVPEDVRRDEDRGREGDTASDDDDIVDAELVDDDEAGEPVSGAPEPAASSDAQPITEGQTKALTALLRAKGIVGPERFDLLSSMLGRDVAAMRDITWDEAATLIDTLQGEATADDAA